MSVYEFECKGALEGEWAYGKEGFEVTGVLNAIVVPIGESDKYKLIGKYGSEDISECTHYLVLHMSDEEGYEIESTIQVIPVAKDLTTNFDTPMYEMEYDDEDRWNKTLAYMIQDKYE